VSQRSRYPYELRERAIRPVLPHQAEHSSEWARITSIAGKLGIGPEALRLWLRRDEVDRNQRLGVTSAEQKRIREQERENRELRRANEILSPSSRVCHPEGDLVSWLIFSLPRPVLWLVPDSPLARSTGPLGVI
jgi:transposase